MLDKLPNSHFRHITGLRKSVVKSWNLNLFLINLVKCQWYERNIYACFRPKLIFLKTFLSHPPKFFYAPHCQVMHFIKANLQHYCKHHRLLRTYINLFLSETNEILKKIYHVYINFELCCHCVYTAICKQFNTVAY